MKKLLMIGVLALTMGQASAQRCLPKMQGIEVSGAFVDGKPLSAAFCGGVALSTYTKNGSKWVFGGEYLQREYGYDEDTAIPVAQFTAEGGYYQKLLTDASKTLFIYGSVSPLQDMRQSIGGSRCCLMVRHNTGLEMPLSRVRSDA